MMVANGTRRNAWCEALEARQLLSDASPAIQLFDAKPAVFVENQGQWSDASVYYAYNSGGASIAFGSDGLRFRLTQSAPVAADAAAPGGELAANQSSPLPAAEVESTSFSMQFVGAHQVTPQGEQQADGVYNYFIGEQADWRSNVPGYQTVSYDNLYDGVTLKTFGQKGSLKYEFHVAAGADYQQIQVHYEGIQGLQISEDGSLRVQTSLGEVVDAAPYVYQEVHGQRVAVAGQYTLTDNDTYRFAVTGNYDVTKELVIDPDLAWATYLGGSGSGYDWCYGIAVDSGGNA